MDIAVEVLYWPGEFHFVETAVHDSDVIPSFKEPIDNVWASRTGTADNQGVHIPPPPPIQIWTATTYLLMDRWIGEKRRDATDEYGARREDPEVIHVAVRDS